jgi:arylsulfatase A-like enzyme
MYLGMEAVIRGRGFHTLADAGDIGGNHNSSFGVDEPSTVNRMLEWVDRLLAGQRFFLTYLPIAGHHPYETPEPGPDSDSEDFGRYRNALRYGDASLGTLINGLRQRGLFENTMWIIVGDHGEAFGQHSGNYGHTFQIYEENMRVPFVISLPGAIKEPQRSTQVVSLIDLAPTLLDLMGIPPEQRHQGRSALDGESRMALFFADYSQALAGLRDGNWKFIHDLGSGHSRLFDLTRDPAEQRNLADIHPSRSRTYADILKSWTAAQKHMLHSAATRSR